MKCATDGTTLHAAALALGGLALCLFLTAMPGPAMAAIGEIPGFPRTIVLNKEKSVPAEGLFVREFTVQGKTWHIPNPAGFTDVEQRKSREALARWEEVAAYNLRDNNLAFFAAPDATPRLPEFSQAHIHIEGERKDAEEKAEFKLTSEKTSPNPAMWQAMLACLTDGTAIDAGLFANALAKAHDEWPYVFFTRGDQKILVRIQIVEGRMTEEEARAREERHKRYEAARKADNDLLAAELPPVPGERRVSFYPCVETSLVFKSGGSHVSMRLEYGPLTKQRDITDAVAILLTWKANFEKINP